MVDELSISSWSEIISLHFKMDEQEYILRYCIILLKKDPLTLCIRVFEICHSGLLTFSWILPTFYMGGIYMSDYMVEASRNIESLKFWILNKQNGHLEKIWNRIRNIFNDLLFSSCSHLHWVSMGSWSWLLLTWRFNHEST